MDKRMLRLITSMLRQTVLYIVGVLSSEDVVVYRSRGFLAKKRIV